MVGWRCTHVVVMDHVWTGDECWLLDCRHENPVDALEINKSENN